LSGKILRLNMDGTIPEDNPIAGSPVWSWGHRNPEGLVYGPNGILYSSEHGDASDDEINIIQKGSNYGWPNVEGYCDRPEEKTFCNEHSIIEPLKGWTPTIAPAGIDCYQSKSIPEWKNSILLTTLKGSALHVLKLNSKGTAIISDQKYFENVFGRLRDLCISPSGDIYISTSNRDWNPGEGFPKMHDDRIIRLHREKTIHDKVNDPQKNNTVSQPGKQPVNSGLLIYTTYCASCHKIEGGGLKSVFPPLNNSSFVTGDKERLISTLINGLSGVTEVKGEKYNQQMPSFKFLSDKDLAAVLSYIRSHFDNHADAIDAKQVSTVRARKK
jgi:mono/diheme cytochrome c family protein